MHTAYRVQELLGLEGLHRGDEAEDAELPPDVGARAGLVLGLVGAVVLRVAVGGEAAVDDEVEVRREHAQWVVAAAICQERKKDGIIMDVARGFRLRRSGDADAAGYENCIWPLVESLRA